MPPPSIGIAQQRIHAAALQLFAERGVTQVSISDLAEAAGVARGTIYNNVQQPEGLFERVAADLAAEMVWRVEQLFAMLSTVDDPALRLSAGMRLWIRRAHTEPLWGRFLARFAFSNVSLQEMWSGPPVADLKKGIEQGRYACRPDQLHSMAAMVAGSVIGAITLVLEGHRTWRDAGADAVEFVLVALGIPREEARELAASPLPSMPEAP